MVKEERHLSRGQTGEQPDQEDLQLPRPLHFSAVGLLEDSFSHEERDEDPNLAKSKLSPPG